MRNKRDSTAKRSPGSGIVFKLAICLAVFGVSGILFVSSARSIMTAYNRSLLLQQAENEVNDLRIENLKLVEKKEKMVDESYVEGEARNRVTYVKDGEIIVVLPETGEQVVLGEEVEKESEKEEEIKGWERWWEILRNGV